LSAASAFSISCDVVELEAILLLVVVVVVGVEGRLMMTTMEWDAQSTSTRVCI
jgi:hypothetical protein